MKLLFAHNYRVKIDEYDNKYIRIMDSVIT